MPSVLIIDDDVPIRQLLRRILTREGYELIEVTNGAQGLKLIEERAFDAILVDLMMPVMGGHELLDALARRPGPQRCNVIVLTAASERHIERIEHDVVHSVVRKPFDLDDLVSRIRSVTKRQLLLVEDDQAFGFVVGRDLEQAGYTLTTVLDGRAALQALKARRYDGVIVDLLLPIISGYDVIGHINSTPEPTPVFVLTSMTSPTQTLPPVAAYMNKSEQIEDVVSTIRRHLST